MMEKYTEEEKKQYNDYWSYYYGTDHHDYYTDCMAQEQETPSTTMGDTGADKEDGKKKGKKRKQPMPKREEGQYKLNTNC